MKRRIIAALTALVMVVTMIPASAFAQSYSVQDVKDLIDFAVGSNSVSYEKRADYETAYSAYSSLSENDKTQVTNADKLLKAKKVFEKFDADVKTVNDEMAKVAGGTVERTDLEKDTAIKRALDAYKVISNDVEVDGYTLDMPTGDALTKVMVEKIGQKNYNVLSEISANETNAKNAIGAINTMATQKDTDIANINAMTYLQGRGNAAVEAYYTASGSVKADAAYNYLAKGYDKYISVAEKVAAYDGLATDVTALKGDFDKVATNNTVADTVKNIDKIHENGTPLKVAEFEADLKKAAEIVDVYGEAINPDFFDGVKYAEFVTAYNKVVKANEKYATKDAVEKAIRELPKVEDIQKADYATLVKYQEQYKAIDADVVGVTDLESTYNTVGSEIEKRMATFDGAYIAADYANRLADAIAKIPADVTRGDVDAVNAAIQVVLDYVKYGKTADASSDLARNITSVNLLDNKTVKTLMASEKLELTDINKDGFGTKSLLGAALDSVNKDAWAKLVQNQNAIINLAIADNTAVEAVKAKLDDTKLNAASINSKETAEQASEALETYNKEYAKLTGYAKSDFDSLYGDYAAKRIAEAAAKIAEYIVNADDILAANNAADAITSLLKIQKSNIAVGNADYNSSVAYINTVEGIIKDRPAVVELLKDKEGVAGVAETPGSDKLYGQYVERKAYIEELTASSNAPTAVINAIESLSVVKENADKATVDSAIAAHKSVAAMYNALTAKEKALVSNYTKFKTVEDAIKVAVKNVMNTEAANIGTVVSGSKLTETQKASVNAVTQMNKTYKEVVRVTGDKLFTSSDIDNDVIKFGDNLDKYTAGKAQLEKETTDAAQAEFELIVPVLKLANTYYNGSAFTVDKKSALDIIAAADAVAGLSDAAKDYADKHGLESTYHYSKLLVAYKDAKALVLDYATIEVADVEFNGTPATPEVVVKDANGIVVDASQYTVAYSNNTLPGTATVLVTAKADGNYIGTVSKEFKVIAKELAKVENVKFDTDYGIVRVFFDRTADLDGVDVRYQVQYKKTTSDTWTTKYPTVGYEYLTLKNLTKNGKYDVRVRAYTDDYGTERVYGEYSDVQTVYANRNGAKSGIMYKAVINSLTTKNGSVTVKVNPVKYTSEPTTVTWKYSYKKYGSQYTTWSTWKTTKNTSYTFNNLTKGVRYVFRVQYTYTSAVDGKTAVNSNYSVYKNIVVK